MVYWNNECRELDLKGKVKANTVDKYLQPIRQQICDLVGLNTSVLEIGCGNGDLLFRLSPKITTGVGLDISESLISYARKRAEEENLTNLSFRITDVIKEGLGRKKYDVVIISLVLHVLKPEEAKQLLGQVSEIADQVVICAFAKPENFWQQLLLYLDQRFSGHYKNFKAYQEMGYMEGMLKGVKMEKYTSIDTFDPVIKIYQLKL